MLINTKGMTRAQLDMITAILSDKGGKLQLTTKPPTTYEIIEFNDLIKRSERRRNANACKRVQRAIS